MHGGRGAARSASNDHEKHDQDGNPPGVVLAQDVHASAAPGAGLIPASRAAHAGLLLVHALDVIGASLGGLSSMSHEVPFVRGAPSWAVPEVSCASLLLASATGQCIGQSCCASGGRA